ncbi:hypothetical protein F4677DRAFT_443747 [Hypoxylon crocopeplum]|nr:hypothetical protein F4677DRAFT_443747 [Hypoxylon crocopeplum]
MSANNNRWISQNQCDVTTPKEVNVTNDYGTPNLLHFYYIPYIPGPLKDDMDVLTEDLRSWHAYELGQAEKHVQQQIEKKNLPSDDSIASRAKRTIYRAKVIQILREQNEAWKRIYEVDNTKPKILEVKKGEENGIIRKELQSHYLTGNGISQPFSVVLNVLNCTIVANPQANNNYWFSHAYLKYDRVTKTFRPDIRTSSFSVTQENKKGDDGIVIVKFVYQDYKMTLDRSLWRKERKHAEDIIATGKEILKNLSFTFSVNA